MKKRFAGSAAVPSVTNKNSADDAKPAARAHERRTNVTDLREPTITKEKRYRLCLDCVSLFLFSDVYSPGCRIREVPAVELYLYRIRLIYEFLCFTKSRCL